MSGRQTGTGKVDPARKFKCTTAASAIRTAEPNEKWVLAERNDVQN